jgi:hypothetical protein
MILGYETHYESPPEWLPHPLSRPFSHGSHGLTDPIASPWSLYLMGGAETPPLPCDTVIFRTAAVGSASGRAGRLPRTGRECTCGVTPPLGRTAAKADHGNAVSYLDQLIAVEADGTELRPGRGRRDASGSDISRCLVDQAPLGPCMLCHWRTKCQRTTPPVEAQASWGGYVVEINPIENGTHRV